MQITDFLSVSSASIETLLPDPVPPKRLHINILLPSLVRGGAERIVCDLLKTLRPRATATLMLLANSQPSYSVNFSNRVQVVKLSHLSRSEKLRTVAMEVLSSPTRVLYAHLIRALDLRYLSESGVSIVPVIHNAQQGWFDFPTLYNSLNIPFVVACADAFAKRAGGILASQLRQEGCSQKIVTLRHEIPAPRTHRFDRTSREQIRDRYGIDERTFLLGMVGQLKPQKNYSRAWQILAKLSEKLDVKLMICGGWHERVTRSQYEQLQKLARSLEITDKVIFAGDVEDVEAYYQAFDCYLNTSDYEGLSIAALEAYHAEIPMVVADVGGTGEAISEVAKLISPADAIDRYVEEIFSMASCKPTISAPKPKGSTLPLWWLLSEYGTSKPWQQSTKSGTLFVINNLNLAGAQRSLTNLLSHPTFLHECAVCTLDESLDSTHLQRLTEAGVKVWTLARERDLFEKVECCLELLKKLQFDQICFWNAAPQFKCLLSKILFATPVKIFDVSPEEMYYQELENASQFGQRIAWNQQQYLARLDTLVVKYKAGFPDNVCPCRVQVIPNGIDVKIFSEAVIPFPLDPSFNPHLAIGTCCRIMPVKRLEFLIEAQAIVETWLPEASLTIVGGVHPNEQDYWEALQIKAKQHNIRFVGAVSDVRSYLAHFKVFVMVSEPGGCPNASLEAMAAGVPIVATRYGGAIDQIEDGKEGYLVSSDNPYCMAKKVTKLLVLPQLAASMGRAARETVTNRFSMEQMVRSYSHIFTQKLQ